MNYSAINIQGNILSSEVLEKIRTEDIRFQNAKDFGLDPQASVRDEISLAWSLALSHWKAFKQKRDKLFTTDTGTTETRNYWMKPLMGILGYELSAATAEIINGKSYAISFRATNLGNYPVHVVGINQSLDARAESGGPRLSPHALAQEYLNNQEHMYALVSNGKFLRLLRDATRLSRLSYIEFNLEQMMEESLYAEFALLYRVLHASRMPQKMDAGPDSILEFYHQEALASGSRIRERLSIAVETSIKELANGFLHHTANESLRTAIANHLDAKDYYLYNLRIIYRVLFLMVIEERKLIFPAERNEKLEQQRAIYYNYYSVQRLSKLVEKTVYVDPKKTDLWQSLVTCFALFEHSKYSAQLGIAPLGSGLFAPDALGIMGKQMLDNETVLKVLRNLVTFESETGQRVRVNYADLDVEEFGSVYEGLLEYEPQLVDLGGEPHFIFKEGNERSKSGSHYTPEELVKPLIQHSLDHLIVDKLKEKDPEAALLSLKVCDVACGSGHILLSAARRIGFELAKLRSKEDQPSPTVLRLAIRDVINNCIYGVDQNPLAVELCKVAMWLEAHNPGEPLNFLDHHIKCGDAIIGLAHREELERGIADEAFKTLPGDDKGIAAAYLRRNKAERKQKEQTELGFGVDVNAEVEAIIEQYNLFKKLPERTPDEVANKEKQYRKFEHDYHRIRLRQLADAQIAQFFITKTDSNKHYLITDTEYRSFLRQVNKHLGILQSSKLAKAEQVSNDKRFFHWFLEFPEVFEQGGFDCILGNPPFLGGQKLSGTFGDNYLECIKKQFEPIGAVDLVTYFFRRIFSIINNNGFQSLISTNTISQGKAREDGLDIIVKSGGKINHAVRSMKWPGQAAVEVSLVTITKKSWKGELFLSSRRVTTITPYLDDSETIGNPFTLIKNQGKSFQGSIVLGKGFLLEPDEASNLINQDQTNKEVLMPYLSGEDLNNSPDQSASRWVINYFDWTEEKAQEYEACYSIVEKLVKPERQRWAKDKDGNEIVGEYALRKPLPEKWWIYGEKRPALYSALKPMQRVLVVAQVSKTLGFVFVPTNQVISMMCIALTFESNLWLSYLQSTIHKEWVHKYASALKSDIRYTPSDVFETFPFPQKELITIGEVLENIGRQYDEHRRQLMLSMQLGLTKTYNAFHAQEVHYKVTSNELKSLTKKDIEKKYGKEVWNLWNHLHNSLGTCTLEEAIINIEKLRELHVQMDNSVLDAYGWSDIQLRHDFYEVDYLPENDRVRFTIHPDARKEVLKRLLELNHKIHEEEVKAGLWDKKKSKKKAKEIEGQEELF
ncbi:Eco57I restriction-modification methylase domain-containing protein [Flavisolibacter tropicus]|uniref:site-specific DNA-methyltransferase (adenine-specific) n=1 Tax=Flavisolibacter tropicus TaxID=1492898 RepID=A0A172TU50_9BACT|nr:DNA methyltransferase [Flavisolibacter tropicus]ANE50641.1 restriction [Flavisolibacter tropicus]